MAPNKRSKLVSGTPRQKAAGAPKIESIKTWGASEHEAWVEMARNQQKAFAESMQEFVGSDLPGFLGDEAVELVAESTKWFESVRQRTLVELQGTSESVLNKMTRFKKQKSVFCQNVKSFRAMEKKRLKARQEVRRITKQQNANITNRTRKTRAGENNKFETVRLLLKPGAALARTPRRWRWHGEREGEGQGQGQGRHEGQGQGRHEAVGVPFA